MVFLVRFILMGRYQLNTTVNSAADVRDMASATYKSMGITMLPEAIKRGLRAKDILGQRNTYLAQTRNLTARSVPEREGWLRFKQHSSA
jgi:hypothetical protein